MIEKHLRKLMEEVDPDNKLDITRFHLWYDTEEFLCPADDNYLVKFYYWYFKDTKDEERVKKALVNYVRDLSQ